MPHQFTLKTRSIAAWSRSLNRTNGWMIPAQWTSPSTAPKRSIDGPRQDGDRRTIGDVDDVGRYLLGRGREAGGLVEGRRVDVDRGDARARDAAASSATARPIPLPAPVTTMTFPSSFMTVLS